MPNTLCQNWQNSQFLLPKMKSIPKRDKSLFRPCTGTAEAQGKSLFLEKCLCKASQMTTESNHR